MSLLGAVGSIAGGIMGSQSSGGAPRWLKRGARHTWDFSKNLANQQFSPYGGERVAGFSPDTMAAFDMFRGGASANPYAAAQAGAQGFMGYQPQQLQTQYNAPQFAGSDLSPYMNPYTNEVIDRSMADIERSRQMADSSMNAQAAAAGAFGGSRHGVANALTNEGFSRQAGDTAANLRLQGFNTAAGLLENDLGRQWAATELGQRSAWANQQADLAGANLGLNATGMYGDLIGAQQGLQQSYGDRMMGAGMMADQRQQSLLDVPYQDYLTQQNWGLRQQGILQGGLGAAGGALAGQAPSTGGGLAGILGGAQLGGQAAGQLGGLWGSIFGGAKFDPAAAQSGLNNQLGLLRNNTYGGYF